MAPGALRGYNEHAAWPVYREPYLWLSGPFRSGSQLLELTGGEAPQVRPVWQTKLLSNDVCSSALADGCLFGFDLRDAQAKLHRPSRGEFRCLDFVSGAQRWSTDGVGQANVLVADGKLILFDDRGELILARVNTQRYEELARVSLLGDEINWTAPALHRGRLYVRNQSRAVCVYLGRPELLESSSATRPLAARDIQRGGFRDLTPLLGIEPEFAFDVPGRKWLRDWHRAGLALLGIAWLTTVLFSISARSIRGRALTRIAHRTVESKHKHNGGNQLQENTPTRSASEGMATMSRRSPSLALRVGVGRAQSGLNVAAARLIAQGLALVLGAAGTTVLSLWRGDFTFTWPVCLFVLFQALFDQAPLRRTAPGAGEAGPKSWPAGVALLAFLAGCAGYYLLCRQLSLVTEWAFLCGFAAATPIACLRRWLSARTHKPSLALLLQATLTLVEFSAYYWASVAVLLWRCRLA